MQTLSHIFSTMKNESNGNLLIVRYWWLRTNFIISFKIWQILAILRNKTCMVQNDILWDENIKRIHLESKLVCTKGVFSIMQIWFDVMKDRSKKI